MRQYIPKNLRDLPLYRKLTELLLHTLVINRTKWESNKEVAVGDIIEPATETGHMFFVDGSYDYDKIIDDSFNYTDGILTAVSSYELMIEPLYGLGPVVVSNKLQVNTDGNSGPVAINVIHHTDSYQEIKLDHKWAIETIVKGILHISFYFRFTDRDNYYRIRILEMKNNIFEETFGDKNQIDFIKHVDGIETIIFTWKNVTLVDGDIVHAEIRGTELFVLINGLPLCSRNDTAITTGGITGFAVSGWGNTGSNGTAYHTFSEYSRYDSPTVPPNETLHKNKISDYSAISTTEFPSSFGHQGLSLIDNRTGDLYLTNVELHSQIMKINLRTMTVIDSQLMSPVSTDKIMNFTYMCDGLRIYFMNKSNFTGAFEWVFSDGGYSTEMNPVHDFPGSGVYTVQLIIGDTTFFHNVHVSGSPYGPLAHFAIQATVGSQKPLKARFTDKSNITADRWFWEFDDGRVSYDQNPEHDYLRAGIYQPKLTIWSANVMYTTQGLLVVNEPGVEPNLPPVEYITAGVLFEEQGYAYYITRSNPIRVAKVRLGDMYVESVLELSKNNDIHGIAVGLDKKKNFLYVTGYTSPFRITRIDLSTFTVDHVITIDNGQLPISMVVDDTTDGMYVTTRSLTPGVLGRILKINIYDFALKTYVELPATFEYPKKMLFNPLAGQLIVFNEDSTGSVTAFRYKSSDLSYIESVSFSSVTKKYITDVSFDESANKVLASFENGIASLNLEYFTVNDTNAATSKVTGIAVQIAGGYLYECVTNGVTSTTEPVWTPVIGDKIPDNNVEWQCLVLDSPNYKLYQEIVNKYKDMETISEETVQDIFKEFGLEYIYDLTSKLKHRFADMSSLLYFVAFLHLFKGHRHGVSFMLKFFNFEYFSIQEWWEKNPPGTPATSEILISLDKLVYTKESDIAALDSGMKLFLRNYVYPIVDLHVAFSDEVRGKIPTYVQAIVDGSVIVVYPQSGNPVAIIYTQGIYGGGVFAVHWHSMFGVRRFVG
jgi:PKD repeat protein